MSSPLARLARLVADSPTGTPYRGAASLLIVHLGDRSPGWLAKASGVSRGTLSRVLAGERRLDPCRSPALDPAQPSPWQAVCRELGLTGAQRRELGVAYGLDPALFVADP